MVFRKFAYKASAVAITLITLAACSNGSRFMPSYAPQTSLGSADFVSPFASKITKIVWGKLPAAKAGTAIKKAAAVKLTVKDGSKTLTGTYPSPITLTNSDKTGASKLLINGKAASKKNTVKKSTDKITLTYTGLAIAPATFGATTKGFKKPVDTKFSPVLADIVYAGPTVTGPEIDLTSNTAGTTGSSGAFTATMLGWTGAPYNKAFTYSFAAISGQTNNCPGQAANAYSVTPASGAAGTAFTVSGAATAGAGECLMTIAGGAGKTLAVTLTYTTTSVGINDKQR